MKKVWIAIALAAVMTSGTAALANQPGLRDAAPGIAQVAGPHQNINVKVPVFTGSSSLRNAWINAAIETEVFSFGQYVQQLNETGNVTGYVSYEVGYVGDDYVSLILYESIMPAGAAHPSTTVKGLTFDKDGNRLTRGQIMSVLPAKTSAEIQQMIQDQTAARNLPIFAPKDWSLHTWPLEWYVGADKHIYFIFQQYEIAPYAAGWIAIDTGVTPDLK